VVDLVVGDCQLYLPGQLSPGFVSAGGIAGTADDAAKKHPTDSRPVGFFPHGFDFVALDLATISAKGLRAGIDQWRSQKTR